jgi:hypothetical protein
VKALRTTLGDGTLRTTCNGKLRNKRHAKQRIVVLKARLAAKLGKKFSSLFMAEKFRDEMKDAALHNFGGFEDGCSACESATDKVTHDDAATATIRLSAHSWKN